MCKSFFFPFYFQHRINKKLKTERWNSWRCHKSNETWIFTQWNQQKLNNIYLTSNHAENWQKMYRKKKYRNGNLIFWFLKDFQTLISLFWEGSKLNLNPFKPHLCMAWDHLHTNIEVLLGRAKGRTPNLIPARWENDSTSYHQIKLNI